MMLRLLAPRRIVHSVSRASLRRGRGCFAGQTAAARTSTRSSSSDGGGSSNGGGGCGGGAGGGGGIPDDVVAAQAVRLYLPGSRLHLLRPAAFAAGVPPVLARLRDLFAAPDYRALHGPDDYVARHHAVLLRQPRLPVVWVDFARLLNRVRSLEEGNTRTGDKGGGGFSCSNSLVDAALDGWLTDAIGTDAASAPVVDFSLHDHFRAAPASFSPPASAVSPGGRQEGGGEEEDEDGLTQWQWRFLDAVARARAAIPRASQVAFLLQNHDAPFLLSQSSPSPVAERGDAGGGSGGDVDPSSSSSSAVVAQRCSEALQVVARLAAESSFVNFTLCTGTFHVHPDVLGGGGGGSSALAPFLRQQRDLTLDLSHNDVFGCAVPAAEVSTVAAAGGPGLFWFGGTAIGDDEEAVAKPVGTPAADTPPAVPRALAPAPPTAAQLVDVAVALMTYRRTKDYADAVFGGGSSGGAASTAASSHSDRVPPERAAAAAATAAAAVDWPVLLLQAGVLTQGRRMCRFDEFHAFAFTHLCFSGSAAKLEFISKHLSPAVAALKAEAQARYHGGTSSDTTSDDEDAAAAVAGPSASHHGLGDGTAGAAANDAGSALAASYVDCACTVARQCAGGLPQQGAGSQPKAVGALATLVLLTLPGVVPLPMTDGSLQDSGSVDTFTPVSDCDVEPPESVPVLYVHPHCDNVNAVPPSQVAAVEAAVRAAQQRWAMATTTTTSMREGEAGGARDGSGLAPTTAFFLALPTDAAAADDDAAAAAGDPGGELAGGGANGGGASFHVLRVATRASDDAAGVAVRVDWLDM